MQNIDKILPVILHSAMLKRPPFFCFFEIETYFLACNPIFGSTMGVQKELDKNFFFLEIIGGHISPPSPDPVK